MARFTDETYLKQWRQRQSTISMSASFAHRIVEMLDKSDDQDDAGHSALKKVLDNCVNMFIPAVTASAAEDDNAYGLLYLRNFTHAYYLASSRQNQEGFLDYFRFQLWAHGDAILRQVLGDEECNRQKDEAAKMDRYIMLMVHIYCNRLLSLAQDREMWIMDNEELIAEYKGLHTEFEEKKMFDEIAAIRYQLIQCVESDTPQFMQDEAASRVYQVAAFEMLNEFNTKPMQLDLAR